MKKPNKFDLIYDEVIASENEQKLTESSVQDAIDRIVHSEQPPEPARKPETITISGSDLLSINYQNFNYKSMDLLDAYKIIASVDNVVEIIKARTEILLYIKDSAEDDIFTNRLRTIMNLFGILKNGILNDEVGANGPYDFDLSEYLTEEPETPDRPTDTETNIDYLVIDYAKNKPTKPDGPLIQSMICLIKASDREFNLSLTDIKAFMNFPADDADLLDDEVKVLELVEILRVKIEKSAV